MKPFICILALLLFASCEVHDKIRLCRFEMIFSDGLPVQFWLSGCFTFNEEEVEGINRACWCQPFQCTDEINIQFQDAYLGPGTESITLPALSAWVTRSVSGDLVNWTEGAAPTVTLPGPGGGGSASSEILFADYAFIPGRQYVITLNYTKYYNSGSSNPRVITLWIYNDSFVEQFSQSDTTPAPPGGSNSVSITFIATVNCTKVGVSASDGSNVNITINSHGGTISTGNDYALFLVDDAGNDLFELQFDFLELPVNGYLHYLSFIPSELSPEVCNTRISMEVREGVEVRAKSDCLHIKTLHSGTKLIEYSNNRNYFGLVYPDISPFQTFYLRVPAVFFHKRFPQEARAIERTSSTIITSSKLKKQKAFQVHHAPQYFHEKIILALSHHNVTIDDKQWKKEEGYEMDEGSQHYPLKKATVYLTEKNFLARNVL